MAKYFQIKMFNPREEDISFDSFLKFPLFLFKLRFLDLEPMRASASIFEKIRRFTRVSFGWISFVALVLVDIALFRCSFFSDKELVSPTSNIPDLTTSTLFTLRAFVSVVHRKDLWNIIVELRAVIATREGNNSKYKPKRYLDEYHFIMKIYASFFTLLTLPLTFPIFSYLLLGIKKLSINYYVPFDPYASHNYPFALFWINFFGYTYLTFMLSADTLLYAVITVISMEFDILKADIVDISSASHNKAEKLKDLVWRHNKLFDIADKLQSIYQLLFLVSFVLSSMVMCYIAFMMSISGDFEAHIFYGILLVIIGVQVLLLCFYGQMIAESSSAVADEISHCNWEDFDDLKLAKHLVLIMMRAQRPKYLTAMGFFNVELATFSKVRNIKIHRSWLPKTVYCRS